MPLASLSDYNSNSQTSKSKRTKIEKWANKAKTKPKTRTRGDHAAEESQRAITKNWPLLSKQCCCFSFLSPLIVTANLLNHNNNNKQQHFGRRSRQQLLGQSISSSSTWPPHTHTRTLVCMYVWLFLLFQRLSLLLTSLLAAFQICFLASFHYQYLLLLLPLRFFCAALWVRQQLLWRFVDRYEKHWQYR